MCKKKPPVPGQENYYHADTARALAKITAFSTCFISFIQILAYVVITGYFDAIGLNDESILIAAACAIIIGVTLICAIGAKSMCLCLPYMFLTPCLCFFYVFKGVMGIYNFIELLESNTNPLPSQLPPGPKGPDDIDYETDPPSINGSAQVVADVAGDVIGGGDVTSLQLQDVTADPPRPMSRTQGIVLLVAILNLLLAVLYVWFVLNVAHLMGRMNDEAEKAKESQREKKEFEAVEHEREAAEAREEEREIAHEAAKEELISLKNSNSGGPAGQFKYFPLGSENGEIGQEGHQGDMSHLGHSGSGSGRYLGSRYIGHSGGHEGHHQNRYLDHEGHHDRYLGHQQQHHDHDNRYLGSHGGSGGPHHDHGNQNDHHEHGHQNDHHEHDHDHNTNHHTQHHH